MTDGIQSIYINPFREWARLLRSLRQHWVAEVGLLKDATLLSPHLGEALGAVAGLINDCDDIAKLIDNLERTDIDALDAFQRALEKV